MKAARFYGKGDVRIEDVAIPEVGPGQYLIEVEWCGICGSDLHEYLSGPIGVPMPDMPHPLTGGHVPVTMGHELCGRIKSCPEGADLKVGDAVMVDPHFTCGACYQCTHNEEHLCHQMGFVGASGGCYGGGLSEYVVVDADMVHRLPDTICLEDAAVIEPLTVAHHSIKTSRVDFQSGSPSVLVAGGGPIGYAMALTLRAHGAKMVILSEPTEKRRRSSASIVDVIIDPLNEKVGDRCRAATGGTGVDYVFDCAGTKRASDDAFDAIKYGGRFVNVAMWSASIYIPYIPFFRKEIQFYSSCCYNRQDFKEVMNLIAQGKFTNLHKMVTRRVGLVDVVEQGFEELINHKDEHVKILISPKAETSSSGNHK